MTDIDKKKEKLQVAGLQRMERFRFVQSNESFTVTFYVPKVAFIAVAFMEYSVHVCVPFEENLLAKENQLYLDVVGVQLLACETLATDGTPVQARHPGACSTGQNRVKLSENSSRTEA